MSTLKKILIICLCICLLTGCKDNDSKWEQMTPTPTPEGGVSEDKKDNPTNTPSVTDGSVGVVSPGADITPDGTTIPGTDLSVTPGVGATVTPSLTGTPTGTITPHGTVTQAVISQSGSITEVSKTMYATTALNIRAESTSNSASLGVLPQGGAAKVTGICDNGWARIEYNGGEAYVFYQYLSDSKVAVNTPTPVVTKQPTKAPNTPTPKPTSTPVPTKTPTPTTSSGSGFTPVNNIHDMHSFNSALHTTGQSYLSQNSDIVQDHLDCVNGLRTSLGLNKLTLDVTVKNISAYRTAEMITFDYFSHYHPPYTSGIDNACVFDVAYFYQSSVSKLAENITYIKTENAGWDYFYERSELGKQLYEQFAASEGHYANMVDPDFTKIGLCVYVSDNYVLITQVFE